MVGVSAGPRTAGGGVILWRHAVEWFLACTDSSLFFFFNDTATTEIYTLSLHDALPIFAATPTCLQASRSDHAAFTAAIQDRKSTRLNSSHGYISYAVFCLKKKTKKENMYTVKAITITSSNTVPSTAPI